MKKKMLLNLASSFAMVLLLFTIVMSGVFLVLFRSQTIEMNRKSMESKAVSIADTLSSFESGRGSGMGRNGMGGYSAYLRFLDELAMADIWIVDEQLKLFTPRHGIYQSNYEQLPENAEQIVKRIFEGELTYGEEFSDILGAPSLTVGAPILMGSEVIGVVLLHSPVSGVNDAVWQGVLVMLAGAMAALLLAGIAAFLLSYRFTRPLIRMRSAALQLVDGNYDAQSGVVQSDEIGELAVVLDELARRLQQAGKERTALEKLRENFVANVSHELRTPVAVLRGSLENLRDGTVTRPEEVTEYYDQMLSESCHLERLVNDLLDLSRLQDKGFLLEMSRVNLCDVVRDTARAIRRTAQNKNVKVTVSCPEEDCIVTADYVRIRQLLLILLDNAVKFSPKNGLVELELVDKDAASLTVTDHGAGILPEELPRIFDRFHKDSTPANQGGTGLGLAIAKEIAERHHAEITVESGDEGTCFSVLFPK